MATDEKIETLKLGNLDVKNNIRLGGWLPDIFSPGLSISLKSVTLMYFPTLRVSTKKSIQRRIKLKIYLY